jgi:type III pantothenate kinase
MNLVVDIGNSRTKAGWFIHDQLTESQSIDKITRKSWMGLVEKVPVDRILVSTVSATDRDTFFLTGTGKKKLLFLDHNIPLPFKISYASPETLGNDRIAAAAGALCLYPGYPLLVMDLGTAITIDFVTASGEYKGGNISPGLATRFKSLHDHTARLPLIEKDNRYPEFGIDTNSAIAAGVQQGILFELNGYMSRFEEKYPQCRFVITGGDAGFFVHMLKKTIFVHPDLVLTGLNHILEFNNSLIRS